MHTISEQAIVFVQSHRKQLVEQCTSISLFPSVDKPMTFLMAGAPGVGKTEFAKGLNNYYAENPQYRNQKIVHIDVDALKEFIPQYTFENSYEVQAAAATLMQYMVDAVFDKKQHAIIDTTFSNLEKATQNISRSLSRNRSVTVFYLCQKPEIAWRYTKAREIKEGRPITKETFIESYIQARINVMHAKKQYGSDIVVNVIAKNEMNGIKSQRLNISDSELEAFLVDNKLEMTYNTEYLLASIHENNT